MTKYIIAWPTKYEKCGKVFQHGWHYKNVINIYFWLSLSFNFVKSLCLWLNRQCLHLETYGAPTAPIISEHGAPQVPAISEYGAPQSPVISEYGAPNAHVINEYGAPPALEINAPHIDLGNYKA